MERAMGLTGGRTGATTQNGSELLAVGQSVTLIARDPMVNNTEVYHETQQIDDEGNVTIPAVGRVRAAGLAASDLQQSINRAYGIGQQAANVDWQVLTQVPALALAPAPSTMPTTAQTGQSGIGGAPTTNPVATAATKPTAVDLVIVIRQSGQAVANNPASLQPAATANPQAGVGTESATPVEGAAPSPPPLAGSQAGEPALPSGSALSPAATEPSLSGPGVGQPVPVPPATGPTR
jgi:hypothetical protein